MGDDMWVELSIAYVGSGRSTGVTMLAIGSVLSRSECQKRPKCPPARYEARQVAWVLDGGLMLKYCADALSGGQSSMTLSAVSVQGYCGEQYRRYMQTSEDGREGEYVQCAVKKA